MDGVQLSAVRQIRAATGLLDSRTRRFDLCRAIGEASEPHTGVSGYERERDQELRREHKALQLGAGFCIDGRDLAGYAVRTPDTVGVASQGGYLVGTENVSFVELARPRSVIGTLGATLLPGLVGNVGLPRVITSVTMGWQANETGGPSDGGHAFGEVSLAPKQVSANVKISRQLLLQSSPAASALIANDLLAAVGQALDVAALGGSGAAGQPAGLVNWAGIGSVSGTTLSNSGVIDLQGAVGARLGPFGGYAASLTVAKLLAKRFKDASNTTAYLWEGGLWGGVVAGEPAVASDNVPASTMVYGSWDQLIVGQWGPLQVEVSPFGTSAADFQAGLVSLRILTFIDAACRDPKAFAAATSVT